MIEFFKFIVFIVCFFGFTITIHTWSVKKGHLKTTEWIKVLLRACTAGLIVFGIFFAITGKMPYSIQAIAKSYDDPFKEEHEIALEAAQAEAEEIAKRKSIPDVNIQTILSDYTRNEVKADNIYKGKVLRIAGIVIDIKKDVLGNPFVILGRNTALDIPLIQASFDESYNTQLANLNKGDHLIVVCKVLGLLLYVQAENCEIEYQQQ